MPVHPVRHAPLTPERWVWWWHRREAAYREWKDMEEAALKAAASLAELEEHYRKVQERALEARAKQAAAFEAFVQARNTEASAAKAHAKFAEAVDGAKG